MTGTEWHEVKKAKKLCLKYLRKIDRGNFNIHIVPRQQVSLEKFHLSRVSRTHISNVSFVFQYIFIHDFKQRTIVLLVTFAAIQHNTNLTAFLNMIHKKLISAKENFETSYWQLS